MHTLTQWIVDAQAGDRDAADRLFTAIYQDLHRLAARQLRGGDGALHTTSLVHETYLRLIEHGALEVSDRGHYFAVAARAMRQIVIDHARRRRSAKRGGPAGDESLAEDPIDESRATGNELLLALDRSLGHLADLDESLVALVEMRFFAGLDLAAISEATGRSERSLKRDWRRARAILHAELEGTAP